MKSKYFIKSYGVNYECTSLQFLDHLEVGSQMFEVSEDGEEKFLGLFGKKALIFLALGFLKYSFEENKCSIKERKGEIESFSSTVDKWLNDEDSVSNNEFQKIRLDMDSFTQLDNRVFNYGEYGLLHSAVLICEFILKERSKLFFGTVSEHIVDSMYSSYNMYHSLSFKERVELRKDELRRQGAVVIDFVKSEKFLFMM